MKRLAVLLCLATISGEVMSGSPNVARDLWPKEKIPFYVASEKPEGVEPMTDDVVRVRDVSVPQILPVAVPGAEKPTPAVVICPGGGYSILAWDLEGTEVAHWLKDRGIAAFVLKYRVPNQRDAALADAQRAVRWVRAHAAEFKVDPGAVGIMGFSAGANLTVRTATHFKEPVYPASDAVDAESCRPDFQLPIYPWDLLPCLKKAPNGWPEVWETSGEMKLDPAYPVDAQTPPAFIVQAQDDFCQIETSIGYYLALRKAGVRSALHVYPDGGHGYGQRRMDKAIDHWNDVAAEWLKTFVK